MKLVFVCRCYVTQRPGGMLHVLQDRAEQLAARGHEVHVLTTAYDGKQRDHIQRTELNGVTVHHLLSTPQVYSDQFHRRCAHQVTDLKPDVLHLESIPPGDQVWWQQCRDAVAGPVVVTMHGFDMGAVLTQWNMFMAGHGGEPSGAWTSMRQQARQLARYDVVIAISEHEQNMLRHYYGIPAVRVYNPIHAAFFTEELTLVSSDAQFMCAAVSGHTERNFSLADAAVKLMGSRLRTVSKCTREAMPAQYAQCRGVILPTRYAQGFDLTLAEAAAMGRGALVTETGSYAYEYKTLGYQLLSPTITAGELAAVLATWVPPDPAQVRALAIDKFHPSVHCDRWLLAVKGPEDAADNLLLYCPQ